MADHELLDIYDEQDQHIGVCPRSEVHRVGHWHHTFHCWLVRDTEAGRMLVFQQRQHNKDTFPDLYDITAAGHLLAGETVEQAVRELEEELGVPLRFDQLTPLFITRDGWEFESPSGTLIDRRSLLARACKILSSFDIDTSSRSPRSNLATKSIETSAFSANCSIVKFFLFLFFLINWNLFTMQ